MTQETPDICKIIIADNIKLAKDKSLPAELRESIKKEMLELKAKIDRIILEYE